MPRKRKTTAIGEKNGYANYKYYSDSLEDLKLWLDYNGIDETTPLSGLPLDEAIGWYVYHIKNDGFFEDSYENYFRGVLQREGVNSEKNHREIKEFLNQVVKLA